MRTTITPSLRRPAWPARVRHALDFGRPGLGAMVSAASPRSGSPPAPCSSARSRRGAAFSGCRSPSAAASSSTSSFPPSRSCGAGAGDPGPRRRRGGQPPSSRRLPRFSSSSRRLVAGMTAIKARTDLLDAPRLPHEVTAEVTGWIAEEGETAARRGAARRCASPKSTGSRQPTRRIRPHHRPDRRRRPSPSATRSPSAPASGRRPARRCPAATILRGRPTTRNSAPSGLPTAQPRRVDTRSGPAVAPPLAAARGASRPHSPAHRGGVAGRQRPHCRGADHGRPGRHLGEDPGRHACLRPRPRAVDLRAAHGADCRIGFLDDPRAPRAVSGAGAASPDQEVGGSGRAGGRDLLPRHLRRRCRHRARLRHAGGDADRGDSRPARPDPPQRRARRHASFSCSRPRASSRSSFQMSFAATVALVAAYEVIAPRGAIAGRPSATRSRPGSSARIWRGASALFVPPSSPASRRPRSRHFISNAPRRWRSLPT